MGESNVGDIHGTAAITSAIVWYEHAVYEKMDPMKRQPMEEWSSFTFTHLAFCDIILLNNSQSLGVKRRYTKIFVQMFR